jgi:hypothetical protein
MSGVCRPSPQYRKGPADEQGEFELRRIDLRPVRGPLSSLHVAGGADPNNEGNEGTSKSLNPRYIGAGAEGWHKD